MKHSESLLRYWDDLLFPQQEIFCHRLSTLAQAILFSILFVIFSVVGYLLPADGFFAFDWVHFFGRKELPLFYPPWVTPVVAHLSWPALIGLTLAGAVLATLKRSVSVWSSVFALLSLPLIWTIFIGQIDGLIALGLLYLPWLAPLALMKPQVSIFAFGARKSHLMALAVVLIISFVIWGFWPSKLTGAMDYYAETGYVNDIALKLWGLPLALPLLWLSRGDMDMLMISGSFITLHLIPYNLLPIVPAIARLRPPSALLACFLSWLPLSANWLGPAGWWLVWLFIAWLWLCLASARYGLNERLLAILKVKSI